MHRTQAANRSPGSGRSPTVLAMEFDSTTRLGRSAATWSLLALATLVTGLPVVSAVSSALKAAGVLAVDRSASTQDGAGTLGFFDERSLRVAEGFAAVVSIPVALTCLVVLAGLLTWRDWAREATLGVFGLTGALLLIFSLNGLTFDPPPRHAGIGVLGSLLVLGVAALALTPGVRKDFEARRLQTELRAREAAAAARRARTTPQV